MPDKADKWLVFVDTNILLDFYRLPGESAERQLQALERHRDVLITGDQVRMEFLKNRQKVILEALGSIGKIEGPNPKSLPAFVAEYQPAQMLGKHLKNADQQHKKIKAKVEKILINPPQNDLVYKHLNRIFNSNSEYNLKRPDKTRFTIRNLARKRFILGYPPRKSHDTSIGDAINWEWIIHCAKASAENHHILIVSRDGDYGIDFGGDTILNDWLHREFKERVSLKRRIELTNKLTDALKNLDEKVAPEDVEEEKELIKQWNVFIPSLENKEFRKLMIDFEMRSSKELENIINIWHTDLDKK